MNDAITGSTRLYALIGEPVAHSLSPWVMNRAFAEAGLDAVYVACRVERGGVARAIDGLAALGAGGANVTYPHKEDALAAVATLSEDARLAGAVNTIVFGAGTPTGHNTDGAGAASALEDFAGVSLARARVFVFGAGGTARAAAAAFLRRGAAAVTLSSRRRDNAETAAGALRAVFPRAEVGALALDDPGDHARRAEAVSTADVVVNATPVGMPPQTPSTALVEDPSWVHAKQCVFDFVYGGAPTAFLENARVRGARTLDGRALLVAQAAESFRLWTGRTFDAAAMLAAAGEENEST